MRFPIPLRLLLPFALLSLPASIPSAHAASPAQLEPLAFLLGEWESGDSGRPGEGTGSATFAWELQGRIMTRTSFTEFAATADKAAFRHDDLIVIYAPRDSTVRADYWDNEGHIIHYTVTVPAPGEADFISDIQADALRYRLRYKLNTEGVLVGTFEMAAPGKPEAFAQYLSWESTKTSKRP